MFDRRIAVALVRRPWLWVEALRTAFALAPGGWWRRWPFLPIPDRSYVSWRRATAYGTPTATMTPLDVVSYLEWRKRHRSQG